MALSRSDSDVFELLDHASSNLQNFYKSAQLITCDNKLSDEDIYLLELTPPLADQILGSSEFTADIKAYDDAESAAFFCDASTTRRLFETETSNSLLLIPDLKVPSKQLDDFWLVNERRLKKCSVASIKSMYLELLTIRAPSLRKLKQHLWPATFTGHIEEEDLEADACIKFPTFEELCTSVPCSKAELLCAIDRLNIFLWHGRCRIFTLDYLSNVLQAIFDMADELSVNWPQTGFPNPQDMITRLEGLYPQSVLHQVFQRFFYRKMHAKDNSIYPRCGKICRLIGENLLSITKKFALPDFISVWCAAVPRGMQPRLHRHLTCIGRAYCELSSLNHKKSITYLPSENLPDDCVESRLTALFDLQPVWPESQLAGYLADLVLGVPSDKPTCPTLTEALENDSFFPESEEEDMTISDDLEDPEKLVLDNPLPVPPIMFSLVHLCCVKLAENYCLIEELNGIPHHLGRQISVAILEIHQHSFTPSTLSFYIKLFSEAYGAYFLSSFRLLPSPVLTMWITGLLRSCSLTSLCLDACQLGTHHMPILPLLGSSLPALRFLSLRNNHLSNDAIRSLTAHGRYYKSSSLIVIDVSRNPFISEKAVAFLTALPSAQVVYLNDTGASIFQVTLPDDWKCHRILERATPRIPAPRGWLWEDYGAHYYLENPPFTFSYESPFVIFRLRKNLPID